MDAGSADVRKGTRNIVVFTVLVLALGWVGRWLDLQVPEPGREGPGMAVWLAAPLVVSLLLRWLGRDGWGDLGARPRLRGNGPAYLVSVLVYPITVWIVLLVGRAAGAAGSSVGVAGPFVTAFAAAILPQFLINIPEESGFRGYLSPRLHALGVRPLVSHVVVGLVWGAWHLPYLRAIMPYTSESAATLAPRFILGAVAASVVYGEIRLATRSVWPAVIMQTVGGAVVGAALASGAYVPGGRPDAMLSPTPEGGLMIALFAVAGAALVAVRRRGSG